MPGDSFAVPFLGSTLYSLVRKEVRTNNELHRSFQAEPSNDARFSHSVLADSASAFTRSCGITSRILDMQDAGGNFNEMLVSARTTCDVEPFSCTK